MPIRSIDPAALCPCGSGDRFDGCCAPALAGTPPLTAEGLMRSRYSAFAVGDAEYLAGSWHPGTRPASLDVEDDLSWTGLEILDTERGQPGDTRGVVEFRAHFQQGHGRAADRGVLHERSRFVFQSGRWWYLDGVLT